MDATTATSPSGSFTSHTVVASSPCNKRKESERNHVEHDNAPYAAVASAAANGDSMMKNESHINTHNHNHNTHNSHNHHSQSLLVDDTPKSSNKRLRIQHDEVTIMMTKTTTATAATAEESRGGVATNNPAWNHNYIHHNNNNVASSPARRTATNPSMMMRNMIATSPLRLHQIHQNSNHSHSNKSPASWQSSSQHSTKTLDDDDHHYDVLIQSPIQIPPRLQQLQQLQQQPSDYELAWHSPTRRAEITATLSSSITTTTNRSILPPPPPPPPRLLQQVAERLRQSILEQQANYYYYQQQQQQRQAQQANKVSAMTIPKTPPPTPLQWAKSLWSNSKHLHHQHSVPPMITHTTTMPSMPTFADERIANGDDSAVVQNKIISDAVKQQNVTTKIHRLLQWSWSFASTLILAACTTVSSALWKAMGPRSYSLLLLSAMTVLLVSAVAPSMLLSKSSSSTTTTTTLWSKPAPTTITEHTLRSLLNHPDGFSLAMAPSFFGFYGYFGALSAWEEAFGDDQHDHQQQQQQVWWYQQHIRSVAGSSAGAMAAVLLAAGTSPHEGVQFVSNVTLSQFADAPGMAAFFKGDKFEQLMTDFLRRRHGHPSLSSSSSLLRLETSLIPVAVTAFDLQTWQGKVLTKGSMAKAARASATFPILFQPVPWEQEDDGQGDYLLVDGGITDMDGVEGLTALKWASSKRLIVNMVVGDWLGSHPRRTMLELGGDEETMLLSISIQNLPKCGPLNMQNGRRAVQSAKRAMLAHLDVPLVQVNDRHLMLRIDAMSYNRVTT